MKYLIVLLCSFQIISAQGFLVRHFIPQSSNNVTQEIFEIGNGAYFGMGLATDTSSSCQIGKITIVGLGNQGQLNWQKSYGNSKWMYISNIFVLRTMIKSGNFLYYTGCAIDSVQRIHGVVMKFNLSGDTVWQRVFSNSVAFVDLIPQKISVSVDGGFFVTGKSINWNTNESPALLIKIDSNGKELWRKSYNKISPNIQDCKSVLQDTLTKKIVMCGYQLDNNSNVIDNVMVTDSLGNLITRKSFFPTGGIVFDAIQSRDKSIVIAGYENTYITVGGSITRRSSAVKFNLNTPTSTLWKNLADNKILIDNAFSTIVELENGDFLVGGGLDTVYGNPNWSNNLPINTLLRFTRIGKDGALKYNKYFNYKNNDSLANYSQGLMSLNLCQDGGWVGAIDLVNSGANPFFFVKYDSTGCDSTMEYCNFINHVDIPEKLLSELFCAYPNPTSHTVFLNYPDYCDSITWNFSLYDAFGMQLLNFRELPKSIEFSKYQSGIYYILITGPNGMMLNKKVVKD